MISQNGCKITTNIAYTQVLSSFFLRAECTPRLLNSLRTMQIAYIPFGVIRPMLNGFCRTHSAKYASKRVYTIGVNAGCLIIIATKGAACEKNARLAYILQDANLISGECGAGGVRNYYKYCIYANNWNNFCPK